MELIFVFLNSHQQHQIPHQGSYEPVPYHVYHQQQYSTPFESRANPLVDMGKI